MSSINGDKARHNRINKGRTHRREEMRILRKKLDANAAAVTAANPVVAEKKVTL
jgi:hypothetical protein